MKTALTIAGSDCSGGAGIQADLKTMTANGVYGMSAITALTAQNTTGVTGIMEVTPEFLGLQLDSIFTDIVPDAVKIGMVASAGLIRVIAQKLTDYHAQNIVLDPVMVATSGARLISGEAAEVLTAQLMPLADLVTPNIPEAEGLTGIEIRTPQDMEQAARQIAERCGCAVLLKGGHSLSDANDYLYAQMQGKWLCGRRIDNPNTHGTGCTLSSAVAANLAKGYALADAVLRAKQYLSGALAAMLDLGSGSGPVNHAYDLHSEYANVGKEYP
ncbi:MAG: bifunctional hydroxymethylpyrimidine kinase/phosphomethylpyrimidine kinase [Oscillospiraceae bacterium]|nr:bifunctional hydroxymethylpyrimidine kinase/phosphomethylpyrimidine kinase [Oscillospiraceae bacterium]